MSELPSTSFTTHERNAAIEKVILDMQAREFTRLFNEYGCVEIFNHAGFRTFTTYPFNTAKVSYVSSFAQTPELE